MKLKVNDVLIYQSSNCCDADKCRNKLEKDRVITNFGIYCSQKCADFDKNRKIGKL